MAAAENSVKQVVLIGASVGKAWNVPELPTRIGDNRFDLKYVGCYRFDKSEPLGELIDQLEKRPDAVILKECAAYFPSDIDFASSKKLMVGWIEQCRKAGIIPIPATIAPVTRSRDYQTETTNPLKRIIKRILGISMMTQMERIAEYNDWLKEYCVKENLVFLDLETPLLTSESERFLRDDLTKGDGLHLNPGAYVLLDQELLSTLERVFEQK